MKSISPVESIPYGWQECMLGEVCSTIVDGTHFTPHYVDYGIPFYSVESVTKDDFANVKYITEAEHRLLTRRCRPQRGDILMTRIGSLGDTKYLNWDVNASIYVSLALLRPGKTLDGRYLYAYTKSRRFVKDVEDRALLWAAPKKINMADLSRVPVLLPTRRDEQRAIAESVFAAEDQVNALERLIAKKQAIKQGMMQQFLSGHTRLPGFDQRWMEGTFEDLASPSKERAMPGDMPPTTPLVDLEQLESGTGRLLGASQASQAVSLKAVFKPGDVLFGKLRAYLRKFWLSDTHGLCTTEIWVFRARPGAHDRYVRYIVETEQFIDVASGAYGTHMPRSDWGTVRRLAVSVPPHDEQVAIASALGDVDAEIGLLRARLAKSRDIRAGMMQQLLTGRTRLPVEAAS